MLVTRNKTPKIDGTTTEGGLTKFQNIYHTLNVLTFPIGTMARPFKTNDTPLVLDQFGGFDKTSK
jgi:hypothetical protein